MKISLKIFLGYFVLVGLAAWFVLTIFVDEVKPGVRQAMEDTLLDTANVLAEFAAADVKTGNIQTGNFAQNLENYKARAGKANTSFANISGVKKNQLITAFTSPTAKASSFLILPIWHLGKITVNGMTFT